MVAIPAASGVVGSRPDLAAKVYAPKKTLDLRGTARDLPNFGGGTCGGPLPELLRASCNTGFGELGIDLTGPVLRDEANGFVDDLEQSLTGEGPGHFGGPTHRHLDAGEPSCTARQILG